MKHMTIGALGEVGRAIHKIFGGSYSDLKQQDPAPWFESTKEGCMHVCIPFSENFVATVGKYDAEFQPHFIVIHSTVPVGTTHNVAMNTVIPVFHSPIRGLHPNLYEGVMTFPKFIGGHDSHLIADEFRRKGLKIILCDQAETTELGKLLDTEYYRACIEFTKRAKQHCIDLGLPFSEVYTLFNQTYNDGYVKLGHPEYVRPVLQPMMKDIAGHCVMPNKELLENPPAQKDSLTVPSDPIDDLPF